MREGTTHELVSELLVWQRERRTGIASVETNGVRTDVYIAKGRPVFAEQGSLGETLGRLLLNKGLLSQEQYRAAIERMTQARIDSEQMRLGEVVVELGYVTYEQILDMLSEQVRLKIARCFQFERCAWSFTEGDDLDVGIGHFPCNVEPLVLLSMRRFCDVERITALLSLAADRFPVIAGRPARVAERYALQPSELKFLEQIDGSHDLGELGDSAAQHDVDGPSILAALMLSHELGLAVERIEPLAAPIAETRPRPVPGTGEIGKAETGNANATKGTAQSPRSSRPAVDPQQNRLNAEVAFQRGRTAVRNGDFQRALPDLQAAVKLYPDAREYALYAAFAELRLHLGEVTDGLTDERVHKAKLLAARALQENRELAFGYYVLGIVRTLEGQLEGCEKFFERAVKLDAGEVDAARQLRLLAIRNAKKSG